MPQGDTLPMNGDYYDSAGNVRNFDGGAGSDRADMAVRSGDFYGSDGQVHNLDEFISTGGGGGSFSDAPVDGKVYARKDAAWSDISTRLTNRLSSSSTNNSFSTDVSNYDSISLTLNNAQANGQFFASDNSNADRIKIITFKNAMPAIITIILNGSTTPINGLMSAGTRTYIYNPSQNWATEIIPPTVSDFTAQPFTSFGTTYSGASINLNLDGYAGAIATLNSASMTEFELNWVTNDANTPKFRVLEWRNAAGITSECTLKITTGGTSWSGGTVLWSGVMKPSETVKTLLLMYDAQGSFSAYPLGEALASSVAVNCIRCQLEVSNIIVTVAEEKFYYRISGTFDFTDSSVIGTLLAIDGLSGTAGGVFFPAKFAKDDGSARYFILELDDAGNVKSLENKGYDTAGVNHVSFNNVIVYKV